jgi:hypothetical protein
VEEGEELEKGKERRGQKGIANKNSVKLIYSLT